MPVPAADPAQLEALTRLPALSRLPAAESQILAHLAVLRTFLPNTTLLSAGSDGDYCYLVLSGRLQSLTRDQDDRQILLGLIEPGHTFGGGKLFGSRLRLTTIRSLEPVMLLQFSIAALREKLHLLPFFGAVLEHHYRQRRVISTLSRVPLFSQLPLADRQTLVAHLARRVFERNATIFEQGTAGQALFLIEQGQVAVEQDGTVIATLAEGDFFGEMALLTAAPHNATLRALTPVGCLQLPGHVLQSLVAENPSLAAGLQHVINERLNNAALIQSDDEQKRRFRIAIGHGLLRGTHILARTPALCPPECRICEQACEDRFGQTRIHLNRVALDELDITTSCRQCRVGAECVESCPEEAIVWDDRGALVVNDACTGCGDCVPACPYDAVEMLKVTIEERGGPLWMLWRRMQGAAPKPTTRMVASKCDLCADYGDRACLSQCPTGSLQLIPVEEIFPI